MRSCVVGAKESRAFPLTRFDKKPVRYLGQVYG